MLSRGKATSGAPICSGMIALAQPAKAGVANSSSMIRPCIVNAWLYSFGVLNTCRPGVYSSARISMASRPPMKKKIIVVNRYRLPMVLWSVVVIHRTTIAPLRSLGRTPWLCVSGARVAVMSLAPGAVDAVGGPAGHSPGPRRGVAAPEVGVELAGLPERAQLLDVSLVLRLRDHLDVEEHLGVVLAAQLGALAAERAGLRRHDLELVPDARDHVHLVEEGRDPEGVVDVARGQLELHALVHGQVQRRQLRLDARLPRQLALDARLVDIRVDVVEVPRPLLADHIDGQDGLGRDVGDGRLVARGEEEEHRDHHDRNDRVQDLERQVVADLRRE